MTNSDPAPIWLLSGSDVLTRLHNLLRALGWEGRSV